MSYNPYTETEAPHMRRSRVVGFWVRGVLLCTAVSATTLLAAGVATAGQQTEASIVGRVTDESGGVLPGVTVTASSSALQVEHMTTVTDERGEYRLTPLRIGTYTVEYTLPGFRPVRQENVRLTVGFTAKTDVVLKVGDVAETVTVSGAPPIVDVAATSSSTTLTRESLELTPTARDGIISLLAQVPGVRSQMDVGGGNVGDPPSFRVYGHESESWITTEGILTSHSRSGGNYFNYTTFDEAKVQTISNEAQIGNPGVSVTMVVKSGGDQFHGSGTGNYMSHSTLEANNIDAALAAQGIKAGSKLDFQRNGEGDLGGPVRHGKVWFYTAARRLEQQLETLGAPPNPDGSPAATFVRMSWLTAKLTTQLNASNRLIAFYDWDEKYHNSGATQFAAWESRTDRLPPNRKNLAKIEWESTHGNSLLSSLQMGYWGWYSGFCFANRGASAATTSLLQTPACGGGQTATFDRVTQQITGSSTSNGNFDDVQRFHGKGTLKWYRSNFLGGNHELQTGFDYIPTYIIWEYDDRGPAGNYQLIFGNGTPVQINIYNNPARPRNDSHHTDVYLKDNWVIARRLTLNLGAVFARDNGFIPTQCREAGTFAPAACSDQIQFAIWNSLSPRLFASYDLSGGNGKTLLKGGYGRFSHVRAEDEMVSANPFVATQSTYVWHDLNGNHQYDPGEVNLDPNGPDFITATVRDNGVPATTFVPNPNEQQPKTDQYALTLEQMLPREFAVRVTGVFTRYFNVPRLLNTKRPYDAYNIPISVPIPGPDGTMATADGRTITYHDFPASLAGRANQQFITINDPRSTEHHTTAEFQLTKRYSRRLQFLASYSATKNDTLVPVLTGLVLNAPSTFDPNAEINTGDHTWEWLGRASGVYTFPANVSVAANFDNRSGQPLARTALFTAGKQIPSIVLNVDPIGTLRLPTTHVLDVRIDKSFTFGNGRKLAPRVNIYNVLNSNTVTGWNTLSGSRYLLPSTIVRPRIVEFAATYTF
jgi:hypothetical protein